jgi:hypothetical protein
METTTENIDQKMFLKGYQFAVQFETIEGDFGEEIYFKDSEEIGPFLRETFKDSEQAKIKKARRL